MFFRKEAGMGLLGIHCDRCAGFIGQSGLHSWAVRVNGLRPSRGAIGKDRCASSSSSSMVARLVIAPTVMAQILLLVEDALDAFREALFQHQIRNLQVGRDGFEDFGSLTIGRGKADHAALQFRLVEILARRADEFPKLLGQFLMAFSRFRSRHLQGDRIETLVITCGVTLEK